MAPIFQSSKFDAGAYIRRWGAKSAEIRGERCMIRKYMAAVRQVTRESASAIVGGANGHLRPLSSSRAGVKQPLVAALRVNG